MALLSVEEEMARADVRWAFSNSYEAESWESIWCEECRHNDDCPLIVAAVFGRLPAAWEERDKASLNRYTCHEYQSKEDQ